jgi:hypothetical protein
VLIPPTRAQHDAHHREHDRHFDQHANHSRKRRAGLKTEQRNSGRDGELEEIRCTDQRRRAGDVVRHNDVTLRIQSNRSVFSVYDVDTMSSIKS